MFSFSGEYVCRMTASTRSGAHILRQHGADRPKMGTATIMQGKNLPNLRVCFGLQYMVNTWFRHVVSSCGGKVAKKRSPKHASKHAVTRHVQKRKVRVECK